MESNLQAADGYLELGMPVAAWDTLEELPSEERGHPLVLAVRVRVYLALRKFEEARFIADKLAEIQPRFALAWVSLARVEATMGNVDAATAFLEKAFAFDPKAKLLALDDPLLEPVWR